MKSQSQSQSRIVALLRHRHALVGALFVVGLVALALFWDTHASHATLATLSNLDRTSSEIQRECTTNLARLRTLESQLGALESVVRAQLPTATASTTTGDAHGSSSTSVASESIEELVRVANSLANQVLQTRTELKSVEERQAEIRRLAAGSSSAAAARSTTDAELSTLTGSLRTEIAEVRKAMAGHDKLVADLEQIAVHSTHGSARAGSDGAGGNPIFASKRIFPLQSLDKEDEKKAGNAVVPLRGEGFHPLRLAAPLSEGEKWRPIAVTLVVKRVEKALRASRPRLVEIFRRVYPYTIENNAVFLEDGSVFLFTGDIPDMWIRDSAAQVHHYLPIAPYSDDIRTLIEGLIRRQSFFLLSNAYANSFRRSHVPDERVGPYDRGLGRFGWIATYNYELDSLCYYLQLNYLYWRATGLEHVFTAPEFRFAETVRRIIAVMQTEQHHEEQSTYRYVELPRGGLGTKTAYTGMSWSGHRPSDDQCKYGYLVPSNMFAVVTLRYVVEISRDVLRDEELVGLAGGLADEIDAGIMKYGIVDHPKYGKIFAYEVDGLGNSLLMDDANVPSLLSIPYIGYESKLYDSNAIYKNTRNFILSSDNPYYYKGTAGAGIGSPHTPQRNFWPMSVIIEGLIAGDDHKLMSEKLKMLENTDAGTYLMHESVNVDAPTSFTRKMFGWANCLMAELILKFSELESTP